MEVAMDEEQVADLKEIFNMYEQGGMMDIKHLGSAMRALGLCPTEAEVKLLMDTVEADDHGEIDFERFVILARSKLKGIDQEETIRQAFRFFDKDGNGTIKAEDLRHIMTSLGEILTPEEVEEMIKDGDLEGNGMIHYDEFVTVMLST